jgi:hypothetical protein
MRPNFNLYNANQQALQGRTSLFNKRLVATVAIGLIVILTALNYTNQQPDTASNQSTISNETIAPVLASKPTTAAEAEQLLQFTPKQPAPIGDEKLLGMDLIQAGNIPEDNAVNLKYADAKNLILYNIIASKVSNDTFVGTDKKTSRGKTVRYYTCLEVYDESVCRTRNFPLQGAFWHEGDIYYTLEVYSELEQDKVLKIIDNI